MKRQTKLFPKAVVVQEGMCDMKKNTANHLLTSQKVIGSGCGIFVAILFAVPLALVYWFAFVNGLGGGHSAAIVVLLVLLTVLFGIGIFLGIRDTVRRWRDISKIQEILGAMTDEERKEFDDAIVQADVELCADETGKTHSIPLDH